MPELDWTYILFRLKDRKPKAKTDVYEVVSKQSSEAIGEVKWHAPWRTYAYFPHADTVYEKTCLGDLTLFLQELMNERKKGRIIPSA